MVSARLLRRQAARCADIARATHDEESRERCKQLEQTYLHLADIEERQIGGTNPLSDNRAGAGGALSRAPARDSLELFDLSRS